MPRIAILNHCGRLIGKLGYGGRADRREFATGAALTFVGPHALSLAVKGSINSLFAALPQVAALIAALALTVVVCVAIVAWFWLWSVLLTRRARDIGLPAWSGVVSILALSILGASLEGLLTPAVSRIVGAVLLTAWFLGLALWPSAGRPFLPRRQSPDASAASIAT